MFTEWQHERAVSKAAAQLSNTASAHFLQAHIIGRKGERTSPLFFLYVFTIKFSI